MGYRLFRNLPLIQQSQRPTGPIHLKISYVIMKTMRIFHFQVYGVCCNLHIKMQEPKSDILPSSEQEIGRVKDGAGSRIVNGKISALGEYPFMVNIERQSSREM